MELHENPGITLNSEQGVELAQKIEAKSYKLYDLLQQKDKLIKYLSEEREGCAQVYEAAYGKRSVACIIGIEEIPMTEEKELYVELLPTDGTQNMDAFGTCWFNIDDILSQEQTEKISKDVEDTALEYLLDEENCRVPYLLGPDAVIVGVLRLQLDKSRWEAFKLPTYYVEEFAKASGYLDIQEFISSIPMKRAWDMIEEADRKCYLLPVGPDNDCVYHISWKNESVAEEIDDLTDEDFYDAMMCLAQRHDIPYSEPEKFAEWLGNVLGGIKGRLCEGDDEALSEATRKF